MSGYCAGCGMQLFRGSPTGESGIFSPKKEYLLCEPCFHVEDALIENEGTNNLPDVLRFYDATLARCHAHERRMAYA